MDILSHFGPNSGYIEDLYRLYLTDKNLVGPTWATFFEELIAQEGATVPGGTDSSAAATAPAAIPAPSTNGNGVGASPQDYVTNGSGQLPHGYAHGPSSDYSAQERVHRMVSAFRHRGHRRALINPLLSSPDEIHASEDTDLGFYNFTSAQLQNHYNVSRFAGEDSMQLQELIERLQQTYCGAIGFETTHILEQERRTWLMERIEARLVNGAYTLSNEQRIHRLQKVIEAELFESELHKKYIGHKRFSLEGGETLIPMVHSLIEAAAERSAKEVIIGMSHRGRLNVLHNILGKPLAEVFTEFDDSNIFAATGSGDVKYHMGFESDYKTLGGASVALSLAPNPSHLEFVFPVVDGMARAKQDLWYQKDRASVVPLIIHGDSAFVGQGVVAESLNMSGLEGYSVGGTVHIIVNNQVGFTTNPDEYRTSPYCTDFAKAVQAPVFHINCEHVEAACWAVALAMEYRMKFGTDVVLDLYCYRKYGHNEGDDPSFTQPIIYQEIKKKKNIAELYSAELVETGVVTQTEVDTFIGEFKDLFDREAEAAKAPVVHGEACAMHGRLRVPIPESGVPEEQLRQIANTLVEYPADFTVHPKLHRILKKRVDTLNAGQGIDWGFAEALAFGSLVLDGKHVRLSGQDCGRGTFSQRHLMLTDNETGEKLLPYDQLPTSDRSFFEVYNSSLSEASVLGFEFGYSSISADQSLVLWEAQFGDFVNGAQVIIDQFISSSEQKWHQLSGVVMLLPHGYEGAGPEHSSARLERFLQLSADGNMTVCVPSSAAQHFHLLRRQGLMEISRPMVILTPKSLLRSNDAAAHLEDLTTGQFHTVLENSFSIENPEDIEHLVFCSGKVYYDIERALAGCEDTKTKVVRVEQLYPFPQFELKKAVKGIDAKTVTWVQEEPRNQGAWFYMEPYLREKLDVDVKYVGRPLSASTATGSPKSHALETKQFLKELLDRIEATPLAE